MWAAITYVEQDETPDARDGPLALVSVFRPDGTRIMRMRSALAELPEMLRWLRAAGDGAARGLPPCPSCGLRPALPELD